MNDPISNLPPQLTTSGASAINGTVCDITRYGNNPRCTIRYRDINTARPTPIVVPRKNPTNDRRNENIAPDRTTTQIFLSDPRTSGRPYRLNIVEKCGIAVSFARGKILTPKNFPPSCGPRILYSSHKTTTEVIATTNIAERYAMRRANIFTSLPDSAPQSRAKFLCRKPQEFALCRHAANKPRTDRPQDP